MSSSSNTPGVKDVNDLKARLGISKPGAPTTPTAPPKGAFGAPAASPFGDASKFSVPTQAAPEPEPEDYNYEPKEQQYDYDPSLYDPEITMPVSRGRYLVMGGIGLGLLIFGFVMGLIWTNVIKDRESVNRRIGIAQNVERSVKPKVENFKNYMTLFKQRWDSKGPDGAIDFDRKFYDEAVKTYASYDFMLDMSNDVSAESIILGQNEKANPLAEIREYSAGTMLLLTLLSNHVAETNADMDEIDNLLEGGTAVDNNITYAVRFNVDELVGFIEQASRTNYAMPSMGIYQVKRALTDDEEASEVWATLKSSMTQEQIKVLTYIPDPKKAPDTSDGLDLPRRLIYEVQARGGASTFVFSDEILTINRNQLFGSSANALDRYRNRMRAIYSIMANIEKVCDPLLSDLHTQATEEKV
ncbi:MAG: hypothetical protein WC966_02475 [Bradymonadales bacterium]